MTEIQGNRKIILVKNADELENAIIIAGFSYRSLAKKIGCSQTLISLILKGERNPSPKIANKICEVLSKEFNDIFFIYCDYKRNQKVKFISQHK